MRISPTLARMAAVLALLSVLAVPCGCRQAQGEGFSIYFPATEIPASQLAVAAHIEIADTPLISRADIVSYTQATHEMELTAAAYDRIVDLAVPVHGRSFVVCVDRRPVYTGAFWTDLSSMSFDGVVIKKPLSPHAGSERCVMKLELGYPGPTYFSGEDPRADPTVLEALERAGTLR
jgi:hypothetical protein